MSCAVIIKKNDDGTETKFLPEMIDKRGLCDFCRNAEHCYLFNKVIKSIETANKLKLAVTECSNSICELKE